MTELHFGGWPEDDTTLDDADTIVLFSDGANHNEAAHPLLHGNRLATIGRQMERGCGLVVLHYSVFVPKQRGGDQFLEWIGGYFDYESGPPPRNWYSKISTAQTTPRPASANHPICRGLTPFKLREEYYYNIRFRENDPRLTPILSTTIPGEAEEQVVAWAVTREDGGRGFGFTGGHFHENWRVNEFRKMVLNAIFWTAKIDPPEKGVQSVMPKEETLDAPIRALIVTGHQYPGHKWRETTAALQEALGDDARLKIDVVIDPERMSAEGLSEYDVLVLNYCNWQRDGLSAGAQKGLMRYLADGGGLVIVHFANGSFHFSLPEAADSDWPEFRKICRRVWDHTKGKSGHDPYGPLQVDIAEQSHPITRGMKAFPTIDELYFKQQGDLPIHVLATAKSKVTEQDAPMAFIYSYGQGRVFQTVLGHAAESIRQPGASQLIRRGTVWAAGRPQNPPAAKALAQAAAK